MEPQHLAAEDNMRCAMSNQMRAFALEAPSGLERLFERYAELTEQAANLDTFRALAAESGMTVVGPPLAQSHPTLAATGVRRSMPD